MENDDFANMSLEEIEAEQQRTLEDNEREHARILAEIEERYQARQQRKREAQQQTAEAVQQLSEATDQAQREADELTSAVQSYLYEEREVAGDKAEIQHALHEAIEILLRFFDPQRDRITFGSAPILERNENTTMIDRVVITLQRPRSS